MKVVIEASEQELVKAKKDLSDISTLAYQMCLMSNLKTANVIADERRFWKKAYQLTLFMQQGLIVSIKNNESKREKPKWTPKPKKEPPNPSSGIRRNVLG